ncbi:hypothetical protein [Bradyrhizobium sp. McL0615]|uniref:hypothetical protein n=1 Tax=Bradyrhizobium sp. McL0615 TaxID=3415673 RepID=UPI003CEE5BB4
MIAFWRDPSRWARDDAAHVFLARAVHEIGKALFGKEWTGDETYVELMQFLPMQKSEGSVGQQSFANQLLVRHHPEFGRKLPIRRASNHGGFSGPPASFRFTDQEWKAAYSIVARDHELKLPALLRFAKVKERIIELAESGKLITALRHTVGGDPVAVHRSFWNSERLSVRFSYCQMHPNKPFGIGVAGDGYCWIFVTRESLRHCVAALAPQPGSAAEALQPESTLKEVTPKKSPGRKKGDGSFAELDRPILKKMEELISTHRAASPEEAARILAGKAHGAGSLESKTERLAKRYRASRTNSLGSGS